MHGSKSTYESNESIEDGARRLVRCVLLLSLHVRMVY